MQARCLQLGLTDLSETKVHCALLSLVANRALSQIKEATQFIKNLADSQSVTTEILDDKLRELDDAEKPVWLTLLFDGSN